ncbi:MAG: MFS transporter [Anaerolineae bacterium]|nr:MFS transporter [Anaerolineae bacterium]
MSMHLTTIERRNFISALWHGAFLALGVALTQPTTVIAAFVADLTGSTIWVGGLSTVLMVAGALPQLLVARWIEPRPRKMPYLMLAIYLRVVSWGMLAGLTYAIGASRPQLLAWVLVGLLAIFYAGGGLGGVPYTDIIGKIIPQKRRGAFFGGQQALAGPLAVGAALLARQVLANVVYPVNYALLFGAASLLLLVASLGFWLIREPPRTDADKQVPPWREYHRQLGRVARRLRTLVGVQLLTGFSLMVLPFYIVYARQELGAPAEAIGWFMLAQVLGGVLANLVWAQLVDARGSRRMLTVCATISMLTPLLAIPLGQLGWMGLLPVIFLGGATYNGRVVGFSSALLELAPAAERPTYSALNAVLILPVAFLSLAAGVLLQSWSYPTLFLVAALFIGMGALLTHRLPGPKVLPNPESLEESEAFV